MVRRSKKATMWLAVVAAAGVPLVTSARCNPYAGTLSVYRDRNFGFLDWFIDDDYYYSDCCYYDDYWVDDFIFFP